MKKILIFYVVFILIASFSIVGNANNDDYFESSMNHMNNEEKLLEIQKAIEEKNASWIAGFNNVFTQNSIDLKKYLGCNDEIYADINEINNEIYNVISPPPGEWDWRNVDNKNWITPIKDQSTCGSCTAFGTVAVLEAVVQIEIGEIFDCDLSEAFLFSCGGGKCDSGFNPANAASFVKNTGVPDEECFPYHPTDMDCEENRAKNWNNRLVKVKTAATTHTKYNIKDAIINYGPVVTRFDVYEDFSSYRRGVYEHVRGELESGHVVAIIGYKDDDSIDTGGYWICKNSWGSDWGENGFFRIAYENCGIDETIYYFDGIYGNIQPTKPMNLQPGNDDIGIDTSLNLTFNECTDFNGDRVTYDIYFDKGTYLYKNDLIVEDYDNVSFKIENLLKNQYYVWKVVAKDEHGSQSHSEKCVFKTRNPLPPLINGTYNGFVLREYEFTATAGDKDGSVYSWFFDWGDDKVSGWIGPYGPNDVVITSHSWVKKGTYIVRVKYKLDGLESDWATMAINLPKNKIINDFNPWISRIIERFPILEYLL